MPRGELVAALRDARLAEEQFGNEHVVACGGERDAVHDGRVVQRVVDVRGAVGHLISASRRRAARHVLVHDSGAFGGAHAARHDAVRLEQLLSRLQRHMVGRDTFRFKGLDRQQPRTCSDEQ